VPGTHAIELALGVNQRHEHRVVFTSIRVEIVVSLGHAGRSDFPAANPMPLVPPLHRCPESVPRIDEHIVASAMGVAIEQQSRLVNPVDYATSGDVFRRTRQAGEGRVEIRYVDDVANGLSLVDHARPPCKRRHPHSGLLRMCLCLGDVFVLSKREGLLGGDGHPQLVAEPLRNVVDADRGPAAASRPRWPVRARLGGLQRGAPFCRSSSSVNRAISACCALAVSFHFRRLSINPATRLSRRLIRTLRSMAFLFHPSRLFSKKPINL